MITRSFPTGGANTFRKCSSEPSTCHDARGVCSCTCLYGISYLGAGTNEAKSLNGLDLEHDHIHVLVVRGSERGDDEEAEGDPYPLDDRYNRKCLGKVSWEVVAGFIYSCMPRVECIPIHLVQTFTRACWSHRDSAPSVSVFI
jgi:hypothetical protein